MYIKPDTKIYLLSGVPLDPTYNHTLWWSSESAQSAYFESKAKHLLTSQSYQRVNKGVMRVQVAADDAYDCNYLMFQNTSFGSKWFYAFIVSVEYVNNITCEITYVIDVMQTWHFDYQLGECYVEREHAESDGVGDHTVPENLEQGPYTCVGEGTITVENTSTNSICVITTFNQDDPAFGEWPGGFLSGAFSGLCTRIYGSGGEVPSLIQRAVAANKADGIISMFMCPFTNAAYTRSVSISKNYSLSGYTPRNYKLLGAPYNILHVYNDQNAADFDYWRFSGSSCTFDFREYLNPEPGIVLTPTNYAGVSSDMEGRLASTGYPPCSWSTDVYQMYLAEHEASLPLTIQQANMAVQQAAVGAVASVAGAIGGAAMGKMPDLGGVAGSIFGVQNAVMGVQQLNAKLTDISTKPAQANGAQATGADFAVGAKTFRYKKYTIRAEYARIIDEYFDMYGYATHRVKVPNRDVRPQWCYTKTVGCVVTGSVPADDIRNICQIYDAGITFWKNPSNVGNYSLDNWGAVG